MGLVSFFYQWVSVVFKQVPRKDLAHALTPPVHLMERRPPWRGPGLFPAIVDSQTGAVHFLYSLNYGRCSHIRSDDEGLTWGHPKTIEETQSGYSDLALLPDGTVLCFYERREFLTVARLSSQWLTTPVMQKPAVQPGERAH